MRKGRTPSSASESAQSPESPLASPLSSPDHTSTPTQYGYTKEYEFDERLPDDKKDKKRLTGGFTYERDRDRGDHERGTTPEVYDKSPGVRKSKGIAFNYAPGDADKVIDSSKRRQFSGDGAGEPGRPTSLPVTTPEKDKGFDVASLDRKSVV